MTRARIFSAIARRVGVSRRSSLIAWSLMATTLLMGAAPVAERHPVVQGRAAPPHVLLLSTDNAAMDAQIKTTLEDLGNVVVIGTPYSAFDGTGLAGYDVVLLVPSYNYSGGDMPAAGQTALSDFVRSGGGLVTGEWTVWKTGSAAAFPILSDAIPVVASAAYRSAESTTYTSVTPDGTLNFGVDPTMTFLSDNIAGTETQFVAKVGATTFYGSDYAGGDGVIGWGFGLGRVISFSTVMGPNELSDLNYRQLLSNAISWSSTPR